MFDRLDALLFLFNDPDMRIHDLDHTERFGIPHWPLTDAVLADAAPAPDFDTPSVRLRSSTRQVSSSLTAPI
jgi:hypothetical protein